MWQRIHCNMQMTRAVWQVRGVMVMVFVCVAAQQSPACCLSQSPRVYMHTPSTGRLVVERLERDRALAPATFLPRNKTIVCWWYEIVGYQGVTATTSPSKETMAGQSRDKIVQVASSSSGSAVLGWGRLNKSKVTTGDDYLDKPYLVSV